MICQEDFDQLVTWAESSWTKCVTTDDHEIVNLEVTIP